MIYSSFVIGTGTGFILALVGVALTEYFWKRMR